MDSVFSSFIRIKFGDGNKMDRFLFPGFTFRGSSLAFFWLMMWSIFFLWVGFVPPVWGGSFPQQFHVEGNQIVDESGEEVVLKGLVIPDPVWIAMSGNPHLGPWNDDLFKTMSEWGAKIVRLSIHPAVWRWYGSDQSFQVIDQAIGWAEKYGMYVYIDFHSIGFPPENDFLSLVDHIFGELYVTTNIEMTDFWDKVSTRYANNKVVAFYEMFNEPARDSANNFPANNSVENWITWKTFNEEIIDVIRINDPDKIVMVGGFQFAYDLTFVPTAPIARTNVVYTAHPYPIADWKIDWETAFGKLKESFPVFVTEFGFDNDQFKESDFNGGGIYRDEIILFLNGKKIGWTAWAFSHVFVPALLTNRAFTPTESGQFFKDQLLK